MNLARVLTLDECEMSKIKQELLWVGRVQNSDLAHFFGKLELK